MTKIMLDLLIIILSTVGAIELFIEFMNELKIWESGSLIGEIENVKSNVYVIIHIPLIIYGIEIKK